MIADLSHLQAVRDRLAAVYSKSTAAKNARHLDWFARFVGRPLIDIPASVAEIEAQAQRRAHRRGKLDPCEADRVKRIIAILRKMRAAAAPTEPGSRAGYARLEAYAAKLAGRAPDAKDGTTPPSSDELRARTLKARFGHVPLTDLDAAAAAAAYAEVPAAKKASARAALAWLDDLIAARDAHPEISALLPRSPIGAMPTLRPRPIDWSRLPAPLRDDREAVIARAIRMATGPCIRRKAREAYGADPLAERRRERRKGRKRRSRAPDVSAKSYRGSVNWLLHYSSEAAARARHARSLREILTEDTVAEAVDAYVAAARDRTNYADPTISHTIPGRLACLVTLAQRGLEDAWLAVEIDDLRADFLHEHEYEARMSQQREDFLRALNRDPDIARRIVLGPDTLLAEARAAMAAWETLAHRKRQSISHVAMCAALLALQIARPVRPGNLRCLTIADTGTEERQLAIPTAEGERPWISIRRHHTKNGKALDYPVPDWTWPVVEHWIDGVRPVYAELTARAADASAPFLFPGAAGPISVQTLARVWATGMEIIGVPDLTPHMMRHVAATIYLALHPGGYDVVAALLRDDPETVRRFYTRDDGAAAVEAFARALEAAYPELGRLTEAA